MKISKLLLFLILLNPISVVFAQSWEQLGSSLSGDAINNYYGYSVQLSSDGNTVAVGAYGNDEIGIDGGKVNVFEWKEGNWLQKGNSLFGEAAADQFGFRVSLSEDGSILAVGAISNDGNGGGSGHVRVFTYSIDTWVQMGTDIDGEAANDNFGHSVSLSANGSRIAIGAIGNDGSATNAGHVRVFDWNGSSWQQVGSSINGEAAEDNFGYSLSLTADGNTVAIGGLKNDASGLDRGHVRVFEWNGSSWQQKGTDIDGEADNDFSGISVSIAAEGEIVAIGGYLNDGGGTNSGHSRIFEWDGSSWQQKGNDIDGEVAGDDSGWAVSLSEDGNIFATGEPFYDGNGSNAGRVRVFEWDGSSWQLKADGIQGELASDFFGYSLSLSGDGSKIAIGAPYNDANGSNSGETKVFTYLKPAETSFSLPITFEENLNWADALLGFGGGDLTLLENPHNTAENSSNYVSKLVKNGGDTWGGVILKLNQELDIENQSSYSVKVWSSRENMKLLFKIENQDNPNLYYELEQEVGTANEWVTLTYDLSAANLANSYKKIVFIIDNGTVGDGTDNYTIYLDDIQVSEPVEVNPKVTFQIDMRDAITKQNFIPEQHVITIPGSFNSWSQTADTLHESTTTGIYEITKELTVGTYEYKFLYRALQFDPYEWDDNFDNGSTLNRVISVSNSTTVGPLAPYLIFTDYRNDLTFEINSFAPDATTLDSEVTITGNGFGDTQNSNKVSLGLTSATAIEATVTEWTNTQIKFTIPNSVTLGRNLIWIEKDGVQISSQTFLRVTSAVSLMTPTSLPPSPDHNQMNVISLFSEPFTNVTVDTWSANWSQANFEEFEVSGRLIKKYAALDYVGIEMIENTIDATDMTHFHIDVWSPDFNYLGVKLVDFGADNAYGNGDDTEHQVDFENPETGKWLQLDIPLSDFSNLTNRKNIAQLILVGRPTSNTTVYVDNVYFYKAIEKPPVISSISPLSGTVGSEVTLSGSGFNETAELNSVWFGAVKASVVTSSSTSIVVTVPEGASHDRIQLINTANGLSTHSTQQFIPTFESSGVLVSNAYPNQVTFATEEDPQAVALHDIDGDGKPDLLVANYTTNTLAVRQNMSTNGTIDANSFGELVSFPLVYDVNPLDLAVGDLDGDGKPDVVVATSAFGQLLVFRNTSTTGTINSETFASPISLSAQTRTYSVAIGDIDGDGKPELAAVNFNSNTISVFQNKTEQGIITQESFGEQVLFTTPTTPSSIDIGDLDGDGKLDLVVANSGFRTVSVHRNTSTQGVIDASSFDPYITFGTQNVPWDVKIGDLDNDGKLDIGVVNRSGNSISLFRNKATAGSISLSSFEDQVVLSTQAVPTALAFSDLDGDARLDIVVTNSNSNNLSFFRNVSSSGSLTQESFGSEVIISTGEQPRTLALGDIDADGRIDVVTGNFIPNTVTLLKNEIPFGSNSLALSSFTPASGSIGSQVIIRGFNFGNEQGQSSVKIGGDESSAIALTSVVWSDTLITGFIPAGLTEGEYRFWLTVDNITVNSSQTFTLVPNDTKTITFQADVRDLLKSGLFDYPIHKLYVLGSFTGEDGVDWIINQNLELTEGIIQDSIWSVQVPITNTASSIEYKFRIDAGDNGGYQFLGFEQPFEWQRGNRQVVNLEASQVLNPIVPPIFFGDFYEPNNQISNAFLLDNLVTLNSFISTEADLDHYAVQAKVGDIIELEATSTFGFELDLALTVLNRTGSQLGYVDSPYFGFGENYTIQVTDSFNDDSLGNKLAFVKVANYFIHDVVPKSTANDRNVVATTGAFSIKATVRTPNLPTPSELSAQLTADSTVTFTWSQITEASKYRISVSESKEFMHVYNNNEQVDKLIDTNSFTLTFAKSQINDNKGWFYYKVRAINDAGETSSFSEIDSVFVSPSEDPVFAIYSFTPTSGLMGTQVTITGSGFGDSQGSSRVRIGATIETALDLESVTWSATQISGTIPTGFIEGEYAFWITVNDVTINSSELFFLQTTTPIITSFSPASGPVGTTITLTGSKFGDTQGSSSVKIGTSEVDAVALSNVNWSDTQLTGVIPDELSAGQYSLFVYRESEVTISASQFSIIPIETVTDYTITINNQSNSGSAITTGKTPQLDFEPVPNADGYRIQIYDGSVSVISTEEFTSLPYTLTTELGYGSTYNLGISSYQELDTRRYSDPVFVAIETFSYPETVTNSSSLTFSESPTNAEYKLIGFKGEVGLISSVVSLNSDLYRVYRWTGSTFQTYTSTAEVGKGYWLLARESVTFSTNNIPASLNSQDAVTISLNSGWNLISNPFEEAIEWDVNTFGGGQAIYPYSKGWSGSTTTMQSGQAYAWNNTTGVTELVLNYYDLVVNAYALKQKSSSKVEKQNNGPFDPNLRYELNAQLEKFQVNRKIELSVYPSEKEEILSKVQTQLPPSPAEGFVPELYFTDLNQDKPQHYLNLAVLEKESGYVSTVDLQLPDTDWITWTYQISGSENADWEQWLVEQKTGRSYDLNDEEALKMLLNKGKHTFYFITGNPNFVKENLEALIPKEFALHQNYPNPFNPSTVISYSLPNEAQVRLEVYDVMGRRIAELSNGMQKAGYYQFDYDASRLASGVYLYRLTAGNQVQVRKMLLVK